VTEPSGIDVTLLRRRCWVGALQTRHVSRDFVTGKEIDVSRTSSRLRIVHFAYEDHRRPWSGGGSLRTHAVNRVLAESHDITVLCARYPGSKPREEDGISYDHIGPKLSVVSDHHYPSLLGYFAALPAAAARCKADLVVEDFGAPFGTVGVPAWTRTPSVGVVQWLFAKQQGAQYHLPFGAVESAGLRSHRQLIAVSEELAASIRSRRPTAEVTVIPNGIDEDLLRRPLRKYRRRNFLYLGRLEKLQKGIDNLIAAFAMIADRVDENLLIAGDGHDERAIRDMAARTGFGERIEFLGRVSGADKAEALDRARVLVVPSRYETFGLVAAEGLAREVPVLAFDIPCLREVIPRDAGMIIPRKDGIFSPRDLADRMLYLMTHPDVAAEMGRRGPAGVARYRWSTAAETQDAVYRSAVARGRRQRLWRAAV